MIGIAAATLGQTGVVASDLVITQSDIKIISVNVDGIKSDLIISQSDIKIVSVNVDGIKSDLIISQSDIKIVSTNVDIIKSDLIVTNAIIDTIASDLVVSQSDIKIISTNVDTIVQAIVNGLITKAQFKNTFHDTTSATYETALEITGSGILYQVAWKSSSAAASNIKITIDTKIIELVTTATHTDNHYAKLSSEISNTYIEMTKNETRLNIEYQDGLKIEHHKGSSSIASVNIIYGED